MAGPSEVFIAVYEGGPLDTTGQKFKATESFPPTPISLNATLDGPIEINATWGGGIAT